MRLPPSLSYSPPIDLKDMNASELVEEMEYWQAQERWARNEPSRNLAVEYARQCRARLENYAETWTTSPLWPRRAA